MEAQKLASLARGPKASGRVGKVSKFCLIINSTSEFRDLPGLQEVEPGLECIYSNFQLDRLRDIAFHKLMSKSVEIDLYI